MLVWPLRALLCLLLLPILPASATAGELQLPTDPVKHALAKQVDLGGYRPAATDPCETCVEEEPNDTPDLANPLALGIPLGATLSEDDVDWFALTCETSGYVAFSTASLGGSTTDTILRVYAQDATTLLAEDDDAGEGLFSSVEHLFCEGGGTLLVEVVHFGTGTGDYVIAAEGSVAPPPVPANDEPAGFVPVDCNGVVEGTTSGSSSQLGVGIDCVEYLPLGGDVFYRVVLPYSYQLNVQVTPVAAFDPSVYLFTDLQNPWSSCIAGSDQGFASDTEIVTFINEDDTSEEMEIYIAVDSWSRHSFGDFLLSLGCEFVIPTETTTWSNLKARF